MSNVQGVNYECEVDLFPCVMEFWEPHISRKWKINIMFWPSLHLT